MIENTWIYIYRERERERERDEIREKTKPGKMEENKVVMLRF
jgi:hypothetical protein